MDHDDRASEHAVEVFGALADVLPYDHPVYCRTVHTRAVTFTCQGCGRAVTQQRYPGPLPRYCGSFCQRQAQRAHTRERVRRLRERQRPTSPGEEDRPEHTP